MGEKGMDAKVKKLFAKTLLFSAMFFCLTGCGGQDVSVTDTAKTEEPRAQAEDGAAENGTGGTAEDVPQVQSEEDAAPASLVCEISTEEDIDWAIRSEGIYCYSNGELCGYLDDKGDRITQCVYEEATPFSEGLACVRRNGKYGYIGKDGEMALPFIYDQASPFREGVAYFSCEDEYGLIDREGNVVLELTDCDSISSFREGLAYFSVDGRYGYMDKNGDTIVEPIYDDVGYFHNGLAIVIKDGLGGVIGKDGTEILPPEYIAVRTLDNCILAQKGDRLFFYDTDGNEISSAPGNQASKGDGIYYISIDNKTGFADENGRIILEPVYERICPILARELVMVQNEEGEYGILDYEGNIVIPFCYYTSVSSFVGDRAVVELNEKYGVLRYDGTLEMPIEYDNIKLFPDGSMAVWTGEKVELTDSGGNLILTGEYDFLYQSGDGYITECYTDKDEREKFWDDQGNLVSEYDFARLSSTYGVKNTYIVYSDSDYDRLLQKGAEDEAALEEVLLTNQITPKIGAFRDIMKNGGIGTAGSDTEGTEYRRQWKKYGKLYRMGEEGSVVLYFYTEPLYPSGFRMSISGLYLAEDGGARMLTVTEECGGSAGGGRVCLWYDTKEGNLKPGITWTAGGFMGSAHGADIYELKQGELVPENAFDCCSQTTGNYSEATLLENAELFYDAEGNTFTKENILEAEGVTEYTVNEKQVPVEDYHAVNNRYICYWPMDLN